MEYYLPQFCRRKNKIIGTLPPHGELLSPFKTCKIAVNVELQKIMHGVKFSDIAPKNAFSGILSHNKVMCISPAIGNRRRKIFLRLNLNKIMCLSTDACTLAFTHLHPLCVRIFALAENFASNSVRLYFAKCRYIFENFGLIYKKVQKHLLLQRYILEGMASGDSLFCAFAE